MFHRSLIFFCSGKEPDHFVKKIVIYRLVTPLNRIDFDKKMCQVFAQWLQCTPALDVTASIETTVDLMVRKYACESHECEV